MPRFFLLAPVLVVFLLSNIHGQIVHRLNVDRFSHYRIDDWISYAPALHITSIDIDRDYIYFATTSGGILRYDKYANEWHFPYTTSSGLRSNHIYRIVYNPMDGFLYAQTPAGIDVYKPAENFWRPANRQYMPPQRRPDSNSLNDPLGDNKYRFPPYSRPPNYQLPDFFTQYPLMFQPPDILFDEFNRQFYFTDRVTDTWQRLWIGTDGFGPMEADMYTFRLESRLQSISDISPRDLYLDDDNIWIGGIGTGAQIGGISRWDRAHDKWTFFEAPLISRLSRDDVSAISGNERYIAFGTDMGVAIYDIKRDKWRSISTMDGLEGNNVYDVLVTDSLVYVGSEFGFNWINLASLRVSELRQTTLDNVAINQLAVDDSLIWAATRFGLYSIDIEDESVEFHGSRAGVIDYNLSAIEVIDDEIWFASQNGITFWNRRTDVWQSFPGLELTTQYRDIAATKKNIWFATDQGLLKYNRKRDYWRIFTEADGLINNNVFHIDPENSYLWITTATGISKFRWKRKGRID
jgi:ligand-binding sensor domain-containing protein